MNDLPNPNNLQYLFAWIHLFLYPPLPLPHRAGKVERFTCMLTWQWCSLSTFSCTVYPPYRPLSGVEEQLRLWCLPGVTAVHHRSLPGLGSGGAHHLLTIGHFLDLVLVLLVLISQGGNPFCEAHTCGCGAANWSSLAELTAPLTWPLTPFDASQSHEHTGTQNHALFL